MASTRAKKKNVTIDDIPKTVAPNAVDMPAAQDGGDRDQTELETTPLRSDAVDEQFPTEALTTESKADKKKLAKLELQQASADAGAPGITPFGEMKLSESDIKWLMNKREREAEANFQVWFAQNFDRMSPAQKQTARELYPAFYQQRLALLEKQIKMQAKIARLKIEGAKNANDLKLQYAIEAGFIDDDQLEHILHPERAQDAQRQAQREMKFRRGLLNPKRLARGDWGTSLRERNALSLTGKQSEAQFPGIPAYKLGTVDAAGNRFGFSAIGDVTEDDEWGQHLMGTLNNLPK